MGMHDKHGKGGGEKKGGWVSVKRKRVEKAKDRILTLKS